MSDKPTYVYKLVPHDTAPPTSLPETLPVSQLDRTSGFVHLSTARQLLGTLNHFFIKDPRVFVLKIPYGWIEHQVRWEDPKAEVCGERGGEGMFPHLYNGLKLGKDEVESVTCWELPSESHGWEKAVEDAKASRWLVY